MIMMIMMITDGDSAGHENDEYDNNHHNFVWLKWFLPYLDRAFYYFLRPAFLFHQAETRLTWTILKNSDVLK